MIKIILYLKKKYFYVKSAQNEKFQLKSIFERKIFLLKIDVVKDIFDKYIFLVESHLLDGNNNILKIFLEKSVKI